MSPHALTLSLSKGFCRGFDKLSLSAGLSF
jgi:hypothetical protein